ncbi:hypothetical protein ACFQS2_06855 [Brachybacterium sp. GCM10030267]|uniref:Rv0361 family membrane protein n=1 Tax=unclassified Brachybacterium TaxID=2623841 RepID=UPI00361C9853
MATYPSPGPGRPASRSKLPWIIGGCCALLALVTALVAVVGGVWFFALRETPEDVVQQYLDAWDARDCETFEAVSTEDFRGEDYTCSSWSERIQEEDLTFETEIGETTIDGDRAEVRITEVMTDSTGSYEAVYDFLLIKDSGDWLLDGSETVRESRPV